MTWVVEPLDESHSRGNFTCGHAQLDNYLQKYARQHAGKGFGRTFVAVRRGARHVLGYYTLSSSSVSFLHMPAALQRTLPRYPVPVALLAKLAVDQSVRGQGLGEFLLLDALHRIVQVSSEIAVHAVEVHAIDAAAAAFYRKYGFQPFQDLPTHLFLPLATVKQLF